MDKNTKQIHKHKIGVRESGALMQAPSNLFSIFVKIPRITKLSPVPAHTLFLPHRWILSFRRSFSIVMILQTKFELGNMKPLGLWSKTYALSPYVLIVGAEHATYAMFMRNNGKTEKPKQTKHEHKNVHHSAVYINVLQYNTNKLTLLTWH